MLLSRSLREVTEADALDAASNRERNRAGGHGVEMDVGKRESKAM